jgi:Ala-tRNA(Pro) deacylase
MAIATRLKAYLDESQVNYETLVHSTAYTAQEVAAATHVPGQELAKTILVRSGEELLMVVLPAPAHLDLEAFSDEIGLGGARLATENEFRDRFPDCDLGAMPPFGNLYDIPVYADESLKEDDQIVFNAGTHEEAIRMAFKDFEECVHPRYLTHSVQ